MQKADPEMTSLNKFVERGSKPFRGEISSMVLGKIYDHLSLQMTFYRGKSIFLIQFQFYNRAHTHVKFIQKQNCEKYFTYGFIYKKTNTDYYTC